MKKIVLLLLPVMMIVACNTKNSQSSVPSSDSEPASSEDAGDSSLEGKSLKVDYTNDGGANIPTSWNDEDNENTVRKATYSVDGKDFSIEFVGKWYLSESKQEYQTKKENPVSFIRAASPYIVKRMVVEIFKADFEIYTTKDHTGTALSGSEETAEHGDGTATSYQVNSHNWSILAKETYKGSNVNLYSVTFYF